MSADDGRQQSAVEYLARRYKSPATLSKLPLPNEAFAASWREASGRGVLDFLTDEYWLPADSFPWENVDALKISFADTLGGRLPAIATESHSDFRNMEALLNGRATAQELPLTVNAFTIQTRAAAILGHLVLLLNRAPYSNIPAVSLGLSKEDWLERSGRLRLRHECAHYETLRIFGNMHNHALDEILADALGQIAAFGDFDADRQRLFFGLTRGGDVCKGRLSFYCQFVKPDERHEVYRVVDAVLDGIADEVNEGLARRRSALEMLSKLATTSIEERLEKIKI